MKKLAISAIVAASLVLGTSIVLAPVEAASKKVAEGKPLHGTVRPYRHGGGYSYKYIQGVNTRRFTDPTLTSQSISGPFDSGFFFSTPSAPHGGDSPYMQ
ncbi:MAG: hypothetical protein WC807_13170 [Hyphomicrobium sp.]